MPPRRPRNAHTHTHTHTQVPSSPLLGSTSFVPSPLTSTPESTFERADSPPGSPQSSSPRSSYTPYSPYSPTRTQAVVPRPIVNTKPNANANTYPQTFNATSPSAYTSPDQARYGPNGYTGPGKYNAKMSFDPFDNTPRPRRKPYSPFSAFESRPESVQGPGEDVEARLNSIGSSISYVEETTSVVQVDQNVQSVSISYSHSHSQASRAVDERVQIQRGQSQGGKHRKSTLSFEIGGPEDETDTDRDASASMTSQSQHQTQYGRSQSQTHMNMPRPSTGDSEAEPPSSREEDYPSGPASSAPDFSAPVSEHEHEQEHGQETGEERDDMGDLSDLAPPRPRFLKESNNNERASWSSQDSSLYPPSSSAPNSDSEPAIGGDSERDGVGSTQRAAVKSAGGKTGRVNRERANTTGTGAGVAVRTPAYKRRSGSYSSVSGAPAAAGGRPVRSQGQVPQATTQGRRGPSPVPNTRRYSGGAHRRSSSSTRSALAPGEIEEIKRSESPSAKSVNSNSGNGTTTAAAGVGTGARTRSTAPPSAYRGSRASLSGLPPGAAAPLPGGAGSAVQEDSHPLSPNPSYGYSYNYNSPSEEHYPQSPSVYGAENAPGMYAYQYPYSPTGYQYPPTPPPVPGSQAQAQPQAGGQQPVYPGGANYPGGGAGYPYNAGQGYISAQQGAYANVPPGQAVPPTPGQPANGVPQSGYATPVPHTPAHNAFMANSAIARASMSSSAVDLVPYAARVTGIAGGYGIHTRRDSYDVGAFAPPQPPFAQANGPAAGYPPPSPRSAGTSTPDLRHTGSLPRLREPFLSPASRRSSSVWAPPTPAVYPAGNVGYDGSEGGGGGQNSGFFGGYAYSGAGAGSNTYLALPGKKEPFPSSALQRKLSMSEKPWITKRAKGERAAWWLTFCVMWIGVAVGAVVVFFGFTNVQKINNNLCSVLDDDFGSFNTDTWTKNISLGGFGNGEFQMTTDSSDNLYIKNGQLYIMPTLTSDEIGQQSIVDGYTYNLTGCTETWNASACSVRSDKGTNTVVNPVKSARISTKDSVSIAYGKVEVVAKMPRGDWLWPAIWMLPTDEKYGAWPRSGEIDIVEARGNMPTYPKQGNNFVRSSLNWGPLPSVIANAFGWQSLKRSSYASGFHTYTLEWTPDFMRISVDSKLRAMLDLSIKKKSFWDRGNFPVTSQNGSTEAVVQDIWEGQPNAAPFDQEFYLIIDLAVGGTSGWFPDKVGGKMWYDGSATAMTDFANAQDTWYATWPGSDDDRALRVDSVKMWKLC